MTLFVLVAAIMGAAMLVMAVGVILSNRCLRGSCGGPEVIGPDGESLSCGACPRRKESPFPGSSAQHGGVRSQHEASAH